MEIDAPENHLFEMVQCGGQAYYQGVSTIIAAKKKSDRPKDREQIKEIIKLNF